MSNREDIFFAGLGMLFTLAYGLAFGQFFNELESIIICLVVGCIWVCFLILREIDDE